MTSYRFAPDLNESLFVAGHHNRMENPMDQIGILSGDESLTLCKDPIEAYQTIMETLKKCSSMVITEDYKGWKSSNFKSCMGKCLQIDTADYLTQHIFFDDNAD